MHRLNRPLLAPRCLRLYADCCAPWSDVTSQDKDEIWQSIEAMQRRRCAYCEVQITRQKAHIEHFEQRSRRADLTFDWENLFGSCNREDSCGRHKDRAVYAAVDLIKPDRDDAQQFLAFRRDGRVFVSGGLEAVKAKRALETIRVFNLNAPHLVWQRRKTLAGYLDTAATLMALAEDGRTEAFLACLSEELQQIEPEPFVTAIRQMLGP